MATKNVISLVLEDIPPDPHVACTLLSLPPRVRAQELPVRSAEMRKDTKGFTLIELMIVIAIIAVIAAIAIPGLLAAQRSANERSAATSLKTLSTAEADFRANDRDWNHVNDFWTFNVCGLFTMTSAAVSGNAGNSTTDPSIKLIELSVASADSDSATACPASDNAALTTFAVPSAKAGYWYI